MKFSLANKIAIITGARRGIGKACALELAKEGACVIISDISLKDCKEVAKEIKRIGGECLPIKCDIAKKGEISKMVKETINKFGEINILVNNAGILSRTPFTEISEKEWNKILKVNLTGYFLCSQIVAKEMIKQKNGGVIINIASVASIKGFKNLAHYCASKAGIEALTRVMAIELAPYNIRVIAVSPGRINTAMDDTLTQKSKIKEKILSEIPLRRIGEPEEVAKLVAFLSSPQASYLTGTTIIIDGGWLAG